MKNTLLQVNSFTKVLKYPWLNVYLSIKWKTTHSAVVACSGGASFFFLGLWFK